MTAGAHRSIDFFFESLAQDQRGCGGVRGFSSLAGEDCEELARIAKYPYVAGRKQEVSLKSAPCEHVSK